MTFLTMLVLKRLGLDPERDVFLNPMGGTGASRLAALESGIVDAVILESPDNIVAQQRGFHELIFFGDLVEFRKRLRHFGEKDPGESRRDFQDSPCDVARADVRLG